MTMMSSFSQMKLRSTRLSPCDALGNSTTSSASLTPIKFATSSRALISKGWYLKRIQRSGEDSILSPRSLQKSRTGSGREPYEPVSRMRDALDRNSLLTMVKIDIVGIKGKVRQQRVAKGRGRRTLVFCDIDGCHWQEVLVRRGAESESSGIVQKLPESHFKRHRRDKADRVHVKPKISIRTRRAKLLSAER